MKRVISLCVFAIAVAGFSSCTSRQAPDEGYLEVIGEYEQPAAEAGYRLNLSYNGPLSLKDKFQVWADSLQKQYPSMIKMNENIFVGYMPEQMDKKMRTDMYQAGVSYNLDVADTAAYNQITRDALKRNFPFNVNVSGAYLSPEQRVKLQEQMLAKALENAKVKLNFLNKTTARQYEIVSIEELETNSPFGHEYYDFNRRVVSKVRVKAKLQ
ncbi:SIMPL domain-containing protein [Pontibacter sp. SGAir0037]|uniref:SIMPL domain-containing protein n=1 Tax=Pontibacter sp. SGAir0037 TaxID=2571030 RepID=UPI0010CD6AE3|nr:SIMPL domain-containing protein [Pontibacter sp. SGAir0037]QCR22978.1 hypothetical protein C1N53_11920 [Pontibacter sp. SGAir0037]